MKLSKRVFSVCVVAVTSMTLSAFTSSGLSADEPQPTTSDEVEQPAGSGADDVGLQSIDPVRLLDTRGGATVDGKYSGGGPFESGETRRIKIAGRSTVPANATAAFFNVTAVDAQGWGFVTVWPCASENESPADVSSLNFNNGWTRANAGLFALNDGHVCLYNYGGSEVLIDISGYALPDSAVHTVTPKRIVDTRKTGSRLQPQETIRFQVAGRAGIPSDGVEAVFVNITADGAEAGGFFTAWPCESMSETPPDASVGNYASNTTVAANGMFPVSSDGSMCVYSYAATDVLVDVSGFLTENDSMYMMSPKRFLDTRKTGPSRSLGTSVFGDGEWGWGASRTTYVQIAGVGGVPADATSAIVTLTAVNDWHPGKIIEFCSLYVYGADPDECPLIEAPSPDPGWAAVRACDSQYGTEGGSSVINWRPEDSAVPNTFTVPLGFNGGICIFLSNTTYMSLIVDVAGYGTTPRESYSCDQWCGQFAARRAAAPVDTALRGSTEPVTMEVIADCTDLLCDQAVVSTTVTRTYPIVTEGHYRRVSEGTLLELAAHAGCENTEPASQFGVSCTPSDSSYVLVKQADYFNDPQEFEEASHWEVLVQFIEWIDLPEGTVNAPIPIETVKIGDLDKDMWAPAFQWADDRIKDLRGEMFKSSPEEFRAAVAEQYPELCEIYCPVIDSITPMFTAFDRLELSFVGDYKITFKSWPDSVYTREEWEALEAKWGHEAGPLPEECATETCLRVDYAFLEMEIEHWETPSVTHHYSQWVNAVCPRYASSFEDFMEEVGLPETLIELGRPISPLLQTEYRNVGFPARRKDPTCGGVKLGSLLNSDLISDLGRGISKPLSFLVGDEDWSSTLTYFTDFNKWLVVPSETNPCGNICDTDGDGMIDIIDGWAHQGKFGDPDRSQSADYDNDGVPDAEEKTICIVGNANIPSIYTPIDTSDCDGDGIHDSVDPVLDSWRL